MENQHRHIKGYRDLTQEEIDLMNEIKGKGEELRSLVDRVRALAEQAPAESDAREADHPMYWVRYADGSLRSGLMYLTRAVARPGSF